MCTSFTSEQIKGAVEESYPWIAGLADQVDVTYVDLPTSHWPMWSRPQKLAAVIGDVAQGASGAGRTGHQSRVPPGSLPARAHSTVGWTHSAAYGTGCPAFRPATVNTLEQLEGAGAGAGQAELPGDGDLGPDVVGDADEVHRERRRHKGGRDALDLPTIAHACR